MSTGSGGQILDIGGGPAVYLDYSSGYQLHGTRYQSGIYFGGKTAFWIRGRFYAVMLVGRNRGRASSFDLVLAVGVIHHLVRYAGCKIVCAGPPGSAPQTGDW